MDGFHDEFQLSAKNTLGKALRRTSWVKEFHPVRWNDFHFISVFDILRFHQFGSTVLPESLLEYVWYVEREILERNSYGSRPWAGGQKRRVRIPQRKAQREGVDLAQIGDNSKKNVDGHLKFYWRRSGSENSNLDKVPFKFEEKFKKTFLENQTGFHHRPKQEVIAHHHSLHRDQRYPHQTCFEKYLGKLVMNLFNKQTYAVYYR